MANKVREMPDMEWVESLTEWLDSKFRIPFTNFRIGLDPIIGLFPVVGDIISLSVSGMIIRYVQKHGAGPGVLLKIAGNTTLDFIISLIPIVGNIYDFFLKANLRNLKILKNYYEKQAEKGKLEKTVDAQFEVIETKTQ